MKPREMSRKTSRLGGIVIGAVWCPVGSLDSVGCRRVADKTCRHARTPPDTDKQPPPPEPWSVQHNRRRPTTARHAFGMFPKPGVAGSIPAGGTKNACSGRFPIVRLAHETSESAGLPTFCRRESPIRVGSSKYGTARKRFRSARKSVGWPECGRPAASCSSRAPRGCVCPTRDTGSMNGSVRAQWLHAVLHQGWLDFRSWRLQSVLHQGWLYLRSWRLHPVLRQGRARLWP